MQFSLCVYIENGSFIVKKKWIALGCVVFFLGSAATGLWLQKPMITETLAKNVETTMNSKLNGTLHFSKMDISLSGKVLLEDPVIYDTAGRKVVEGKELSVLISPSKALAVLQGQSILEAIDSINVDTPTVYVWQNDDQTWNVTTLIKPTTSPQQADFRSLVRFHDGTIEATLPDGQVVTAKDCEGTVDFTKYPALAIDGSGTVDGKSLSISGTYTSNRHYNFTINSDGVNAVYANAFLPDSVGGTINSGDVSNIKLYVSQSQRGFTMSGQGDVENGAATIQGYNLSDVKGHASFSGDDVVLHDVTSKVNGQGLTVNGIIKTNTDTPVFDVQIKAPSVDIVAFGDAIPAAVTGTVGVDGTVWGTMNDLQGRGTISATGLTYDNLTVDSATAQVSYVDHILNIEDLQANAAGGTVALSGAYNVNDGNYQVQGKVQSIGLDQIPSVPISILGTVSADFTAYGNSQDNSVNASAHVIGQDTSYNGLTVDSLAWDVTYADNVATLSNFTASLAGGTITASGTYDAANQNPNISFTAQGLPLDMIQPYVSVPVSGTVDAAGHVSGTAPMWDVTFNARNGAVQGLAFTSIDGSLQGQGQILETPGITWRSAEGTHTVSGSADLGNRTVDLHVLTNHVRVEQLLPLVGKENLPFTGWADNDIHVQGSLDNLQATGQFQLTSGSYSGYLYKNISADYRLDNGTVYITNGDISSYNASLSVYGSIGKTLDLHFVGENLDIARMMPWNKTPRQGVMAVTAHLGGTPDKPTATGTLRAPYLTINHMALADVRGDFNYDGNVVHLSGLHFNQHNGSYDGDFIYNTSSGWMNGRADVTKGDLASLLQIANVPLKYVTGEVNGILTVNGLSSNPTLALKGQLTDATLDGRVVDPAPLDLALEDGVFHVNQLTLQTGDSLLAAQGTYAFHGPVSLQVAAKNFPSRVLLDMLGKEGIAIETPIDFAAELGGTGDDVEANVSAQLNGGTINGVSFTNAYSLLNIKDGIIHVNQAYVARDPYKASMSGTIPVEALQGNRPDKSMDLTVRLDNAGLDVFTFLTPYVESATGSIGGSLNITGTLADPKINGSVMTQGGSVKIKDVAYPLDQINGSIVFNGRNVVLNASGTMDKKGAKNPGNISLEGNAAWQGWKLTQYSASADMEHLNVDSDYYKGPLTGYATVTEGEEGIPKISGLVSIDNATLDVPLSFAESSGMPDIALDFTVTLGDKVRLYNPALYDLMLNGAVNFKGTTNNPTPSGRIEAQRGTIHYLDTNFKLTKAKADFSVSNSFIPTMDIEGQSRVGQYMVQLTLRGPADNMNMILRSDPPLTRQQIVSLITLRNGGKQQSSLNEEDLNNLMGSGIRLTLNSLGITQEIERALSLDMLTVTNGSLDLNDKNTDLSRNYYNIEMGKYLFNDFMLTAAFGLNHGDTRIGMQYDLGSRFSLNAWKSDDANFAGGLYRYSF